MKHQLEEIRSRAKEALKNANIPQDIEDVRVKFLGKKGEITAILKQMGKLSAEERPAIGQLANEIRTSVERQISEKAKAINARR